MSEKDPTVLLVDDQIANILSMEQVIADLPLDVIKASSGVEALQLLHDEPVDLVISDVAMPDMDGIEVCRTISSDPRFSIIPVILVIGRLFSDNAVLQAVKAGAADFVAKPVQPPILRRKIELYVELSQLRHLSRLANSSPKDGPQIFTTLRH